MDARDKVKPQGGSRSVWRVLLTALCLLWVGEALGLALRALILFLFPDMGEGMAFLTAAYLPFLGIDAVVAVYGLIWNRPMLGGFGAARRGGMRGNTARAVCAGLLLGFGANALCVLAAYLHGDLAFSLDGVDAGYLTVAFAFVLVQSCAEEFLTRGYLLGALRERCGIRLAVVLSAVLFGVLHLMNSGITVLSLANAVLAGVVMGLLVYRFDSLWMAAAFHTMWNYTQNILFGLPNSGLVPARSLMRLEAARGSAFYHTIYGVEGAVTTTILLCLMGAAAYFLRRGKERSGG